MEFDKFPENGKGKIDGAESFHTAGPNFSKCAASPLKSVLGRILNVVVSILVSSQEIGRAHV